MEDYEERFSMIGDEIQRLNGVLKAKTEENQAMKEELMQSKQFGLFKQEENEQLQVTHAKLNDELTAQRGQLQRMQFEQQKEHIGQY